MVKIKHFVVAVIVGHIGSGLLVAAEVDLKQYPFDNLDTAVFCTEGSTIPKSPFPTASADRFSTVLIEVEKEAYQLLRTHALMRSVSAVNNADALLKKSHAENDQQKAAEYRALSTTAMKYYANVFDTPEVRSNHACDEVLITERNLMQVLQWAHKIETVIASHNHESTALKTRVCIGDSHFEAKPLLLAFIQRMRDIEKQSKSISIRDRASE